MSVFDRIKVSNFFGQKRPSDTNSLLSVGAAGWSLARKKYSDIYLWTVVNKVFAGLRSVDFYFEQEVEGGEVLCDFIEKNITAICWQLWLRGHVTVAIEREGYRLITENIRTDGEGYVIEPTGRTWCTVYSDEYAISRRSSFEIIKNELDEIDALRSSDNYLTLSLGAIGILTGRELGMSEIDKERFMDEVKKKIGTTPDKYQFLIATGAVDYKPISIPVGDLKLNDKAERSLKLICDYFNVPYDIVSFSGNSTYANMDAAIKLFYSNCISSIAEVVLTLGRYIVRRQRKLLIPSKKLTFKIDNSTIDSINRSEYYAMIKQEVEMVKALNEVGVKTDGLLRKIEDELK